MILKNSIKDQVTAALVTAVHQIEQNANTLNQAMHGLRESIQDNAATKANSKYINEDQPEQQNYDQQCKPQIILSMNKQQH